jgi:hypothetical protein
VENPKELSLLDDHELANLNNELDAYDLVNSALLGDRLAGMNGQILVNAIHRSQALKGLSQQHQESIQNNAIRLYTLETAASINDANARFNKWFFPVLGIFFLVLTLGFFVPDNKGGSQADNEQPKAVKYTEWVKNGSI